MAGESDEDRTEAATGKQLEKAREKGDIPRSREAATCLLLLAGGCGIWLFSHPLVAALDRLMVATFTFQREMAYDPALLSAYMSGYAVDVVYAMAPIIGLIMVAIFAAPMLLGGFTFNFASLTPNFGKMNPISGITRMFSLNSLVELGKASAKAILVGVVALWAISGDMDAMMGLGVEALSTSPAHLGALLFHAFIAMCSVLIIIAAVDVPYQAWKYAKKLRMTKEQVKQEHKEQDGDPHVKGKIRQLQRAMARRRMMSEVPSADVVVTNPTHYAVALKYTEGSMNAPKVVAKGSDEVAARIRELAKENGVAIMEAPPLARALHFHAEIGDEIPESLYTAVAEVLAYIFQLRSFNSGEGVYPERPGQIAVPIDLDPLNPAYHEARAAKISEAAIAKAAQHSGST
ncbi:flagellar type III secretion system protein FlhB [Oxalobacteraceae bacterium CAVE-383]|nr:flagellar type III secretion system protein FlhB [Oxalobacteraceae bacterium CAVE-383]